MDLGREWERGKLQAGRAYMHNSIAKKLGVVAGDVVFLKFDATLLLGSLWEDRIEPFYEERDKSNNTKYILLNDVILPITVEDTYGNPLGKYANGLSNVILMEYESFLDYLRQHINPAIPPSNQEQLASQDLYEYATSIVVNLPHPRISYYIDSNYDNIQKAVVKFAASAVYKLGFNQLDCSLPVLENVETSKFFGLFLGLILNIVIFILLFLSILLLYSLLMINVETRTFEMGVLRVLGSTRVNVVQLLVCISIHIFNSYNIISNIFSLIILIDSSVSDYLLLAIPSLLLCGKNLFSFEISLLPSIHRFHFH